MASTITWDLPQIKRTGKELCSEANEIFSVLKSISAEIDNTKASFDSPEGSAMRSTFANFSSSFSKFQGDIKAFGDYLDSFSTSGTQLQDELANIAKSLPSAK